MSASIHPAETELVHFSELTNERLGAWFERAFLDPEFDEDGDLVLRIGRRRFVVCVDPERSTVAFFLGLRIDPGFDRARLLEAINRANRSHLMVRSLLIEPTGGEEDPADPFRIVLDHQWMVGEGFVTPRHAVLTLRRFAEIAESILDECIGPALVPSTEH